MIDGSVLEVTLDRPKANAIDGPVSQELGRTFANFRDDPELRVAIITGGGEKFFCAGWDLKAAAGGEGVTSDFGVGGFGGLQELPDMNQTGDCGGQRHCLWRRIRADDFRGHHYRGGACDLCLA